MFKLDLSPLDKKYRFLLSYSNGYLMLYLRENFFSNNKNGNKNDTSGLPVSVLLEITKHLLDKVSQIPNNTQSTEISEISKCVEQQMIRLREIENRNGII